MGGETAERLALYRKNKRLPEHSLETVQAAVFWESFIPRWIRYG